MLLMPRLNQDRGVVSTDYDTYDTQHSVEVEHTRYNKGTLDITIRGRSPEVPPSPSQYCNNQSLAKSSSECCAPYGEFFLLLRHWNKMFMNVLSGMGLKVYDSSALQGYC